MSGKRLRYGAFALSVLAASSLLSVVFTARQLPVVGVVSPLAGSLARAALPHEAQLTFKLIQAGGPYPYMKDGTAFGNFERRLPVQPRGYYREYTVKTPHARDRGARRIICGGPPCAVSDCYYTNDHYASFKRIVG